METINSWLKQLDQIQGLSAVALVFLSCIVVGYALRFIKRFPNDGIPVVVILWGALAMLFIADPRANSMSARIWTGRNILIGLFIGFLAWIVHKIALSRLEDMIARKFELANTAFFRKTEDKPSEPEDKTKPSP